MYSFGTLLKTNHGIYFVGIDVSRKPSLRLKCFPSVYGELTDISTRSLLIITHWCQNYTRHCPLNLLSLFGFYKCFFIILDVMYI